MSTPSTDPSSVKSAAMALVAQYGEDAEVIAVLRAAELAAEGDAAGLAHLDAVIACIAAMNDPASGQLSLN